MFNNVSAGIGAVYSPVKHMCYNRTGASLLKGQVAMLDIAGTQSETSGSAPHSGNPNGSYANLTPCTQGGVEAGYPILVCAEDTVADNALGAFYAFGEIEVAVLDDDVSTTDIDKGDPVSILVSESAVAVQAFVTGGTGTRFVGLALEDAAASSSTAARTVDATSHLRWVLWTGGVPCMGLTDT